VERLVGLILDHLKQWGDVDITIAPEDRQEMFARQLARLIQSREGEGSSSSPKQRLAPSSLVPKDEAPFDMVPDAADLEHEARQLERHTPGLMDEPEERQ
jgi:hypothetical protein